MTVHATVLTLGLCLTGLCFSAAIARAEGPATQPSAGPTPQLSPSQVVKVVMAALKDNDAADSGIRVTFKFASPANQTQTGPVERFIPMVKGEAYAPMLNHKSAVVREVAVQGDQAVELVTLTDAAGHTVYYMFQLSRQHGDGPCKDCWMTDGVVRVQPKADTHTA